MLFLKYHRDKLDFTFFINMSNHNEIFSDFTENVLNSENTSDG